jgi:hypothetical protein
VRHDRGQMQVQLRGVCCHTTTHRRQRQHHPQPPPQAPSGLWLTRSPAFSPLAAVRSRVAAWAIVGF